jgi:uncharacterized membrane protein YeaQ/YmgE (transglycosylase-associated protein family)
LRRRHPWRSQPIGRRDVEIHTKVRYYCQCGSRICRTRYLDRDRQLDHPRLDCWVHRKQDRWSTGFWLDIALGIVGALVGGFLFDLFGASGVTGLNIYSMIVAVVGSVVMLVIYNAVTGRRRA